MRERWKKLTDFLPRFQKTFDSIVHGTHTHGEKFAGRDITVLPHGIPFEYGDIRCTYRVEKFSTHFASRFPNIFQDGGDIGGIVYRPASVFLDTGSFTCR